jgi:hypothetical protein
MLRTRTGRQGRTYLLYKPLSLEEGADRSCQEVAGQIRVNQMVLTCADSLLQSKETAPAGPIPHITSLIIWLPSVVQRSVLVISAQVLDTAAGMGVC